MASKGYIAIFIDALIKFCTDKVDVALWPDGPTGEDYLNGLVRVDHKGVPRGSYVVGLDNVGKTLEFLKGLDGWEEFAPMWGMRAECRYYKARCPNHVAFENVVALEHALKHCRKLGDIVVEDGLHGKEIVWYSEIDVYTEVDYITLIVEGGMMSTWFPGQVYAAIPHDLTRKRMLEEWRANPHWSVKVVYRKAAPKAMSKVI